MKFIIEINTKKMIFFQKKKRYVRTRVHILRKLKQNFPLVSVLVIDILTIHKLLKSK